MGHFQLHDSCCDIVVLSQQKESHCRVEPNNIFDNNMPMSSSNLMLQIMQLTHFFGPEFRGGDVFLDLQG